MRAVSDDRLRSTGLRRLLPLEPDLFLGDGRKKLERRQGRALALCELGAGGFQTPFRGPFSWLIHTSILYVIIQFIA